MNDNTEINQQQDEQDEQEVIVKTQGVSDSVGLALAIIIGLSGGFNIYQATHKEVNPTCAVSANVQAAQMTLQETQQKAAMENQKEVFALEQEVAKDCVKAGHIPVFNGGNVSCVNPPK